MNKQFEGVTAYPLTWPEGWSRTKYRNRSRFDTAFTKARQELQGEIERLGGTYPVLSTNLELRLDGQPYANKAEPADPGVALYFLRKDRQMVFACDRWDRVKDNLWAIKKTMEAMRGIERWGASDMMDRAFSAFEALPAPGKAVSQVWWRVLDVDQSATVEDIQRAYRARAKLLQSTGAHDSAFAELNVARDNGIEIRKREQGLI